MKVIKDLGKREPKMAGGKKSNTILKRTTHNKERGTN